MVNPKYLNDVLKTAHAFRESSKELNRERPIQKIYKQFTHINSENSADNDDDDDGGGGGGFKTKINLTRFPGSITSAFIFFVQCI